MSCHLAAGSIDPRCVEALPDNELSNVRTSSGDGD